MAETREDREIAGAFDYARISKVAKLLPMICLYDHPTDYPDKYVARVWDGNNPTRLIALADTPEEIRATIPSNMTRLPRTEKDDPCIMEVWI